MIFLEFSNGSRIKWDKPHTNMRGNRANRLWYPFIDEEGNGCCTNVITSDTYKRAKVTTRSLA